MIDAIFSNNPTAAVLLSIAIMITAGFLLSRVTRLLKLPDVTAYIVVGVVIGPFVLNIIPMSVVSGMGFITDMALGFIAFGVGKYLKLEKNKINKTRVVIITLCETIITMSLVVLTMHFIFKFDLAFSFLLGAIACATAPASTVMTIRQYKAKGGFINTLLQVIAIDDAIAILIFHICLIFVQNGNAPITILEFLLPIAYNIILIALGIFLGWALKKIMQKIKSSESRLMITLVIIIALTSVCSLLNIFPLLPCLALGAAYVNLKGDQQVFDVVDSYLPPIVCLFFVYSGMMLNVTFLLSLGVVGITYFVIRIIGKSVGSYVGGSVAKSSTRVKKYIGLALIPQASVSIGLAALAQRIISTDLGVQLSVIILSSAVLYELIGPVTARLAIIMSNSVPGKKQVVTTTSSELDDVDEVVDNTLYVSAIQVVEDNKNELDTSLETDKIESNNKHKKNDDKNDVLETDDLFDLKDKPKPPSKKGNGNSKQNRNK